MASSSGPPLVTLDNFEEHVPRPINSPRSLEACLRLGVDPLDLVARDVESFLTKGTERALAEMQQQHFERRRKGAACGDTTRGPGAAGPSGAAWRGPARERVARVRASQAPAATLTPESRSLPAHTEKLRLVREERRLLGRAPEAGARGTTAAGSSAGDGVGGLVTVQAARNSELSAQLALLLPSEIVKAGVGGVPVAAAGKPPAASPGARGQEGATITLATGQTVDMKADEVELLRRVRLRSRERPRRARAADPALRRRARNPRRRSGSRCCSRSKTARWRSS